MREACEASAHFTVYSILPRGRFSVCLIIRRLVYLNAYFKEIYYGKQEIHQHQRGCPTDATAGSGGICDKVHTFQGSECEKNLLKARWAEI